MQICSILAEGINPHRWCAVMPLITFPITFTLAQRDNSRRLYTKTFVSRPGKIVVFLPKVRKIGSPTYSGRIV